MDPTEPTPGVPVGAPHDGEQINSDGSHSHFIFVANSLCIACQTRVNGWGIALGEPYHGIIHYRCRGWAPLNADWPHPYSAASYQQLDEPQKNLSLK